MTTKDMPDGMNDLREFLRFVDESDADRINFQGDFTRRVGRNIRSLLAYWNTQRDTIRLMGEREIKSNDEVAALEKRQEKFEADRAALLTELSRKAFEIQILQMTQGALKMEIDRLRAGSAPTIAANGAEITILTDGTVRIKADCLSVTCDVVPV